MSDTASEIHAPSSHRRTTRTRASKACTTCRVRRTRCDSERPACGYCRLHNVDCHYEPAAKSPLERIHSEILDINQKLHHITNSLSPSQNQHASFRDAATPGSKSEVAFTLDEKSPFQLVGTDSTMMALGLDGNFARSLLELERAAASSRFDRLPELRNVQQHQGMAALASFSAHVHPWYPILPKGFTEWYEATIFGPLMPGPDSCLALLVAALGFQAQADRAAEPIAQASGIHAQCLEAAMSSLPNVLLNNTIQGVQSLFFLAVYNCCAVKPIEAYDYVTIASIKVQNLLRSGESHFDEHYEQAKRAFWAVLLLESELLIQFNVVSSGIWSYEEKVSLPSPQQVWHYWYDAGASATISSESLLSPADAHNNNRVQSYFLAEIAMRRMLHRCNTAITKTPFGEIVYAPAIALELELQLEEWYSYLPEILSFDRTQDIDVNLIATRNLAHKLEPQTNFLRVQYYCCKISIYWPAVYQCVQSGIITGELSEHCGRFFDAYIQVMPSLLMSLQDCIVNRWTIFASVFMTTMAAMLGAGTAQIRNRCSVDWSRLAQCFNATTVVEQRLTRASPSLSLLAQTLEQRRSIHANVSRNNNEI